MKLLRPELRQAFVAKRAIISLSTPITVISSENSPTSPWVDAAASAGEGTVTTDEAEIAVRWESRKPAVESS
ncbi:MAG: hypothetical protein LBR31_02455 [Desulfovibrio sp.]|nr:hypothetical protein [Desulfovibrio sp.]